MGGLARMTMDRTDPTRAEVYLYPEVFRLLAYTALVATLASGFVWTRFVLVPAGKVSLTNNTLYEHFGYNNACLYIDDLPVKYLAIFLSTIFSISWVAYDVLFWVRAFSAMRIGRISRPSYYLHSCITVYSSFAAIYFLGVFVVHPSEDFFMHTLPFSLLIISVSLVGIRNVVFGHATGRFGGSVAMTWLVNFYLVVLVVMSVMKVVFQFMGIVLLTPPSPALGQLNDQIWMLCALVVPVAFDLIGLCCMRDKMHCLHITVGLAEAFVPAAVANPAEAVEIVEPEASEAGRAIGVESI